MNVYRMSEFEWWAAPTYEAAVLDYVAHTGEFPLEPSPVPLSQGDLERFPVSRCEDEGACPPHVCPRDENGDCTNMTTLAQILVENGDQVGLIHATEP